MIAGEYEQHRADDQPADRRLEAPASTRGRRRNSAAQRQQPLAEQQRDDAADDAERRVGEQLRRMHEVIGRHVKQRLVAENRSLDDDRGDRRDDGRAEQRGVHVADDFFEREQHGGDRRVERRRQRAGGADRHEIAHALAATDCSQRPISDARPAPICTDGPSRPIEWPEPMHSTPVRNLPNGTRAGNHAARQVVRRLGLRHAAAAHVGKHLRQQNARDEAHRAAGRRTAAARDGARPNSRWLVCSIATREQHGGEAGEDADDDRQDEKQLVLAQPQLLRARDGVAHFASAPCRRPMRASA